MTELVPSWEETGERWPLRQVRTQHQGHPLQPRKSVVASAPGGWHADLTLPAFETVRDRRLMLSIQPLAFVATAGADQAMAG